MDLDELKKAWHTLDLRLQKQNEIQSELFHENRIQRIRTAMLPLALSHFGIIVLCMLGVFIMSRDPPSNTTPATVWYCAIFSSLYFLGVVALSFVALLRYGQIDYSAPVMHIQEQIARLDKAHAQCSMFAGAMWFLIWLPFGVAIFYNFTGVNVATHLSAAHWIANAAVGAIGVGAVWASYRWAQRNPGLRLAGTILGSISGATLRKAQAEVDELKRFHEG